MEELSSNNSAGIQCRSFYDGTLTPEDIKKAEVELHETKATREKCLQTLREMIKGDSELTSRTDDAFLLRFLRVRKFDCDRAFQLIQKYYTAHANYAVYQNFLPSTARSVLSENRHMVLPYRDPEGRVIMLVRVGMTEPSAQQFQEGFRTVLLSLEKAVQDETTQINGFVGIADYTGFSMTHVRHLLTARNTNCGASVIQECLPGRFKMLHMVFEPWFMDVAYAIIRPLLTEKSKQRVCFHGSNMASLHQYIPPSILPEEYGGLLGPVNNQEWANYLLGSEDTFLYDQKFGYLNPKKEKTKKSFFGLL